MRSVSCLEQHEIGLRACREAGIQRTSNVLLARTLGMIPVGTMGHEHVQRYGADEPAFRAMRERRPGRSSYLLDTYDTIGSGIPTAFKLIREDPGHGDSIRYDSGDKEKQYRFAVELAKSQGIRPVMPVLIAFLVSGRSASIASLLDVYQNDAALRYRCLAQCHCEDALSEDRPRFFRLDRAR